MAGHGEKLSRKSEKAIAALLSAGTLARAAAAAGIAERTLRNWLKRDDFKAAFERARREHFAEDMGLLGALRRSAITTVGQNLSSESTAGRNRAAALILEHSLKALEVLDLLPRLEAVERAVAQRGGAPPATGSPAHRFGGNGDGTGG
jgi:hypothetical protein